MYLPQMAIHTAADKASHVYSIRLAFMVRLVLLFYRFCKQALAGVTKMCSGPSVTAQTAPAGISFAPGAIITRDDCSSRPPRLDGYQYM